MQDTIAELQRRVDELERLVLRNAQTDPDKLYTAAEVASALRCQKSNVYGLVARGEIAAIRIGAGAGGIRIKGSDITAFLDHRKEGGPSPEGSFRHLAEYLS